MGNKKNSSITLLRVIATILITNSHFDLLYPVSALAVGGAFGNALFFMCSGYCLTNIRAPFYKWYKKRVLSIYPVAILATLISIVVIPNNHYGTSLLGWFQNLIWPNYYWFIGAIVTFYIPYYFLCKNDFFEGKKYILLIVAIVVVYLFLYIGLVDTSVWTIEGQYSFFKWIYYFALMAMGAHFKKSPGKNKGLFYGLECIIGFVVWFGYKVLMYRITGFIHLQFISQVGVVCFTIGLFRLALMYENKFKDLPNRTKLILNHLGDTTLEIYLVNMIGVLIASRFLFPVNVLVAITSIIMMSSVLHISSIKIKTVLLK